MVSGRSTIGRGGIDRVGTGRTAIARAIHVHPGAIVRMAAVTVRSNRNRRSVATTGREATDRLVDHRAATGHSAIAIAAVIRVRRGAIVHPAAIGRSDPSRRLRATTDRAAIDRMATGRSRTDRATIGPSATGLATIDVATTGRAVIGRSGTKPETIGRAATNPSATGLAETDRSVTGRVATGRITTDHSRTDHATIALGAIVRAVIGHQAATVPGNLKASPAGGLADQVAGPKAQADIEAPADRAVLNAADDLAHRSVRTEARAL